MSNETCVTVVPQALIDQYQERFRILRGWVILSRSDIGDSNVWWNTKTKEACIHPCPANVDMDHYVLHEILHVVFAAICRKGQETTTQDLCKIICEQGKELARVTRERDVFQQENQLFREISHGSVPHAPVNGASCDKCKHKSESDLWMLNVPCYICLVGDDDEPKVSFYKAKEASNGTD